MILPRHKNTQHISLHFQSLNYSIKICLAIILALAGKLLLSCNIKEHKNEILSSPPFLKRVHRKQFFHEIEYLIFDVKLKKNNKTIMRYKTLATKMIILMSYLSQVIKNQSIK